MPIDHRVNIETQRISRWNLLSFEVVAISRDDLWPRFSLHILRKVFTEILAYLITFLYLCDSK